jgi:hypothetical protein
MRASAAVVLVVAMLCAAAWPNRSFADCKYPDVLKALGTQPDPNGIEVVLVSAGTKSNEFLEATATALDNLRRTETGLIRRVALETSDDGAGVESRFIKDQAKYNAFVVLDSEFMSGTEPKYNRALDYYRGKQIKPHTVMVIDRYLTSQKSAAFVQVTAERDAENAALMIEVAAAVIAHHRLATSEDFAGYATMVTGYAARALDNPERPKADEVTKAREEMITKCLAVAG